MPNRYPAPQWTSCSTWPVAAPYCQGRAVTRRNCLGIARSRDASRENSPRAWPLCSARQHGNGNPRQECHIPQVHRCWGRGLRTYIQIRAAAEQRHTVSRVPLFSGVSILGNGSQQSFIVSNHLQSSTVPSADMGELYAEAPCAVAEWQFAPFSLLCAWATARKGEDGKMPRGI